MSEPKKTAKEAAEEQDEEVVAVDSDDDDVPGFVPLRRDLNPIITHEEVRAVELSRPVLPGSNEERKSWALAWFTARRLMLLLALGGLAFYFFLLNNHITLHRSYPVNFPEIDERKHEARMLEAWRNTLGNVRIRRGELKELEPLIQDWDRLTESLIHEHIEQNPDGPDSIDALDDLQRKTIIAESLTLDRVVSEFKDPDLIEGLLFLQEENAKVADADWSELEDASGEAGPLRMKLQNIANTYSYPSQPPPVEKLVKGAVAQAFSERRTADIEWLRNRDLELRQNYFSLADRKVVGTWVFFILAIAFVLIARVRWRYNPLTRLPIPNPNKGNEQLREAKYARIGYLGALALLVLTYVGLMMSLPDGGDGPIGERYATMLQRNAEERANRWRKLAAEVGPDDFVQHAYQYRGGDEDRVAAAFHASDAEELWSMAAPEGMGSPLVWKNQVIVAGATPSELNLVGLDSSSGGQRWKATAQPSAAVETYSDDNTGDIFRAAATPVTDGARVYAVYGSGDLLCVEMAGGAILWQQHLGLPTIEWCHVASPVLYQDQLIVHFSEEKHQSSVRSLSLDDGSENWRVTIPGHSWGTPVVWRHPDGDLIVATGAKVHGIDPADGSLAWESGTAESADFGPSPVIAGDQVLFGLADQSFWAFGRDGSTVWQQGDLPLPDYPSPVAVDGQAWILTKGGELARIDAASGKKLASGKLKGEFWANPLLIGTRLLATSTKGEVHVLDAESLQRLGGYELDEKVFATPAANRAITAFRTTKGVVAYHNLPAGEEEAVTAPAAPPTAVADAGDGDEAPAEPAPPRKEFILATPAEAAAADPALSSIVQAQWAGFRGPGTQGVHPGDERILGNWNGANGDGVIWKTELPLSGIGQPVIWGDRVFINAADADQRLLLAYQRQNGEEIWRSEIPTASGKGVPKVYDRDKTMGADYMFAATTPATDGERVYCVYANGDLAAVDAATGEPVWVRDLGLPKNAWGHSQSPLVHNGMLIVPWDHREEGSACFAFDAATGKEIWHIDREKGKSFASASVVETRSGWQLYLIAEDLRAYDPATGEEIWRAASFKGDVGPTPIFTQEKVYAQMKRSGMYGIRIDGTGQLDETHVVWEIGSDNDAYNSLSDTASMVTDGRRLWNVDSRKGIVTCVDVQTGSVHYIHESLGEGVWAAPVLIGDRVLMITTDGKGWWIAADSSPAVYEAGTIPEPVYAAPAIADGDLFIRGKDHLYCIGEKE